MTPARKNRADIQALRGIAVLLVVVNHVWAMRLPGGYVGVDVFFVISGFLITAHLLGEITRSGRVSLPAFYARRARRLLPAALTVTLASLTASLIWLPADRWERIGREAFGASAYFLNWLLAASSVDYSAQSEAATPVQHYWSLSVEEQFYLLWPLTILAIVWLIMRHRRRFDASISMSATVLGSRRGLAAAFLTIAVASFAFSVFSTEVARSAAYFNTFGRVWEFALGGLLAVTSSALGRRFAAASAGIGAVRSVAQLIGYAAIAGAALSFDSQTAFPGPWALLPAAGTALVIAAGPETPRWSPVRLLAWRPIQYTGDISYSLYLWHWPVIVITPFVLAHELRFIDRIAVVALSFGLAALTKHFIEDPGRTRWLVNARPRMSLFAAAGSIAVVGALVVGLGVVTDRIAQAQSATARTLADSECFGAAALEAGAPCPDPFGPAILPAHGSGEAPWDEDRKACSLAPDDRQILVKGSPAVVNCDFSRDSVDPLKVWLVGDSHAEHWKATVYAVAEKNNWVFSSSLHGGCPTLHAPLTEFQTIPTERVKQDACLSWGDEVSEAILSDIPDLVLVSNFAAAETVDDGSGAPQLEQLTAAARERFGAWNAAGASVVVIRDVPTAGATLGAECVALYGEISNGCVAPESDVLPQDPQADSTRALGLPGVTVLDLSDQFCVNGTCSGVIGGVPVFFDSDHLSRSYARTLAPVFATRLSELLRLPMISPQQHG
ncbi:acyltransferase family protein [Leucobacter chironomi]|uniref:acyltransferase family protein n=1 Tax=Leucobacter chironomi TaxID=491918 RepID=UPI0004151C30|nr:acyltransferase family protein [Leucobacter chironomi]